LASGIEAVIQIKIQTLCTNNDGGSRKFIHDLIDSGRLPVTASVLLRTDSGIHPRKQFFRRLQFPLCWQERVSDRVKMTAGHRTYHCRRNRF
jgi:hypothetical protein